MTLSAAESNCPNPRKAAYDKAHTQDLQALIIMIYQFACRMNRCRLCQSEKMAARAGCSV
jgi:hypothetical protein